MVEIPMKSTGAMDKQSIMSINRIKVYGAKDKHSIQDLNQRGMQDNQNAASYSRAMPSNTASPARNTDQTVNAVPAQVSPAISKRPWTM